jgi:hypothetical protein
MNMNATMTMSRKRRRYVILPLLVALFLGVTFFGLDKTGAYFSDTQSGTISGSLGNVHVTTSGGTDALDFAFTNMLPGDPQTVTANYQNNGSVPEDIWIVFPNATALSAFNNLGTYGVAHLSANGTDLFDSANLDDNSTSCGAFTPNMTTVNGVSQPGCWPLLSKYLLVSGLAPGASGNVSFTFNYASKLTGQPAAGTTAPFNTYPVAAGQWSPTNTNGQFVVNSGDGSGSGLPYAIVAEQTGVTP